MEVIGQICTILPTETGQSQNGVWSKSGFIIATLGAYSHLIKFGFFGDRINLAQFPERSFVTVKFDAVSKEYEGKWYTELNAYDVRPYVPKAYNAPITQPVAPVQQPAQQPVQQPMQQSVQPISQPVQQDVSLLNPDNLPF